MLRGIYAFYLFFFVTVFFVSGVALVPLGYLATLIVKSRLVLKAAKLPVKREAFMFRFTVN